MAHTPAEIIDMIEKSASAEAFWRHYIASEIIVTFGYEEAVYVKQVAAAIDPNGRRG